MAGTAIRFDRLKLEINVSSVAQKGLGGGPVEVET